MSSEAPLLIGLKSDFLSGLDPLKKWCSRADQVFRDLQLSNIYRVEAVRVERGWLSELWAVCSVQSAFRTEELEMRLFSLSQDLSLEATPLLWGQEVLLNPQLPLPHPDLHRNPVFLQCATEVAPDLRHPILGQSLIERLNEGGRSAALEFYAQGRHVFDGNTDRNKKRP